MKEKRKNTLARFKSFISTDFIGPLVFLRNFSNGRFLLSFKSDFLVNIVLEPADHNPT